MLNPAKVLPELKAHRPVDLDMRAVSTRSGFVLARGWLLWRKRLVLEPQKLQDRPIEPGMPVPDPASTLYISWKRVFCVLKPTEVSLYDREFDLNSVQGKEEEEEEVVVVQGQEGEAEREPKEEAENGQEARNEEDFIRRLPSGFQGLYDEEKKGKQSQTKPKLLFIIPLSSAWVRKVPDAMYDKPNCLEIWNDALQIPVPEVLMAMHEEVRDNWLSFLAPCICGVEEVKFLKQGPLIMR